MTTHKSINGPLLAAEHELFVQRYATYDRARRAAGHALQALRVERDRSKQRHGQPNNRSATIERRK